MRGSGWRCEESGCLPAWENFHSMSMCSDIFWPVCKRAGQNVCALGYHIGAAGSSPEGIARHTSPNPQTHGLGFHARAAHLETLVFDLSVYTAACCRNLL